MISPGGNGVIPPAARSAAIPKINVRRALLIEVDAEVDDRMEHQYVAVVGEHAAAIWRGRLPTDASVDPADCAVWRVSDGVHLPICTLCMAEMVATAPNNSYTTV